MFVGFFLTDENAHSSRNPQESISLWEAHASTLTLASWLLSVGIRRGASLGTYTLIDLEGSVNKMDVRERPSVGAIFYRENKYWGQSIGGITWLPTGIKKGLFN